MRYRALFATLLLAFCGSPGQRVSARSDVDLTRSNRRPPTQGLPDWSHAGYEGGSDLPGDGQVGYTLGPAELASTYNVIPNDDQDDTPGLEKAIHDMRQHARTNSFALIQLPAGVLNLKYTIYIDTNYLIIRGAGTNPNDGGTVLSFSPDENTRYDVLEANGSRWSQTGMKTAWKYQVSDSTVQSGLRTITGSASSGWLWPGRSLFRVGSKEIASKFRTPYDLAEPNRKDLFFGTLNYHWRNDTKVKGFMADQTKDIAGHAGSNQIYYDYQNTSYVWEPGQDVWVAGPIRSVDYDSWGVTNSSYYVNEYMFQDWFTVVDVGEDGDGKFLVLDHPLAFDVYSNSAAGGAQVMEDAVSPAKVMPIERPVHHVGIENLYITQPMDLNPQDAVDNYGNMRPDAAMHGIVFRYARDCWVRSIRTYMTGSHPIATEVARFIQIQDNYFDGSWNKGAGGNGYLRGSRVWDSLYFNNVLRNLRHFTFQWCSMRNVALYNDMTNDFNLHGGWEGYNLAELNTIVVPYEHRAGSCSSNCGGEGGASESGTWAPIYWSTGAKASKWSGATGPQNVFHRNYMLKSFVPGGGVVDYLPYFTRDASKSKNTVIWQFGWDRDSTSGSHYQHLTLDGGSPLQDWQGSEQVGFQDDPARGVSALLQDKYTSLFLSDTSGLEGPPWFSSVTGVDVCPANSTTTTCDTCPTNLHFPADFDEIFSRELFTDDAYISRNISPSTIGTVGLLRRDGKDRSLASWDYQPIHLYLRVAAFLAIFYQSWITTQEPAHTSRNIVTGLIGNTQLVPDTAANEPVNDAQNPSWSIMEAWRPLNIYRSLLYHASQLQAVQFPVRSFLSQQFAQDLNPNELALSRAIFPDSVRDLLVSNEEIITQNANRDWVGRGVNLTALGEAGVTSVAPREGVQVAYGRGIEFYQRGAVGPLSIEAAFILATQVAGVDWRQAYQSLRNSMSGPGQWTVGGILPPERIGDRDRGSCIQTMVGTAQRRVGFVWRSSQASGRGDGRIGFYIAIDLDPDLPPDSDTHNVFIFAVHTADQHSRVNINLPANTTLRGLTYTPYTPAADDAGTPLPGSRPDLPPAGDNTVSTRTNIQFIAHAHAGIMRYSVWTEFLHQQPSGNAQDIVQLRGYTSISFLHFYIQSEREWDGYPRERYLDGGNNGT